MNKLLLERLICQRCSLDLREDPEIAVCQDCDTSHSRLDHSRSFYFISGQEMKKSALLPSLICPSCSAPLDMTITV